MPVVGEAHIIVRAITTNVAKDIRNGFNGVSGSGGKQAERTGQDLASRFMRGFSKGGKDTSFLTKLSEGMNSLVPSAEQAYQQVNALIVSGYKGSAMAGIFATSIGALIGGLVALIGAAAGAAASFTAVIGLFISMKAASAVAKMAFEGVGDAVQKAVQEQKNQVQTIKNVREELQQLKFDAEQAALSEESAAIALEKAREGLARTADLPADSRARREAELAYKEAELNYRRAKDKSADLNEELRTGAKARAAAAARDPYANLTATQKGFAKFLVTLQPLLKTLRESVAKGFLPLLQSGITKLLASKSFDAIFNGITNIGKALGQAVKPLFDFLSSAEATGYLNQIFSDIAYTVKQFGPILTKFVGVFLKIMAASGPIVRKLADYIDKMLGDFKDFLDQTGDTKLTEFFITAADMAGKFGKIAGNILGGFGKIIEANFGPGTGGDILLNWLIEATSGFGMFGTKGKTELNTFFQSVALNTKSMLGGVGGIIQTVINLAADPRVGEFWDTVKSASPVIGEILTKANSAMPIIGKIIVKIIDIINKLTDSGAVDNFFNTILGGFTFIDDILNNKVVGSVQEFTGRIHAITLALGKLKDIVEPIGLFMYASVSKYAGVFGAVKDGLFASAEGFRTVATSLDGLKGNVKKTIDSFKAAALNAEDYAKKLKRAQDYTGFLKPPKIGAKFFKNATKQTRDLIASNNKFAHSLGRINLGYEAAGVRFKIFQARAIKGFQQMQASQNKFVSSFGHVGEALTKHPILLVIGLLIAAFAALYATNEEFKKQIDNAFRPALDSLKAAWDQIITALQPVFVAFKGLIGMTGETSNKLSGLEAMFVIITQAIAGVIQILAPLIANIVQFLAPAIALLINGLSFVLNNIINPLIPAIIIFTSVIGALNLAIALQNKILAINKKGWLATIKASKLWQTITKIGTAIQAAFNFVMSLSPLTWIVIGIVALIAAMIWLAQNTTFFTDIWKTLSDLFMASIKWIGDAFGWLMGAIKSVWDWIVANWPLLLAIITGPIGLAIYFIMNNWNAIVGFFQMIFKWISDIIMGYINFWIGFWTFLGTSIWNIIQAIPNAFMMAFDFIVNLFKGFVNTGIGLFEGFVNFFLSGINMIIKGLNMLSIKIPDWVPFVGGQTWGVNIPEIPPLRLPRLADGGVVMPSYGGSLVNVAEAGKPEKVVPLDSNGLSAGDRAVLEAVSSGNGINITVNAAPGMDVNALATEVGRKIAFQMRKGSYA